MTEIVLDKLSVRYAEKKENVLALDGLSYTFHPSFNVVLGASGCGKTTLLKTLAGLLEYQGRIVIDGVDVSKTPTNERNMAFVSQQYILYPTKTIFDNIAFPLKMQKIATDEIKQRVFEIAKQLDLTACLTRKPKQISGGQQQRAAIAKALIKRPSICLLDEPLSNIDPKLRAQCRQLIKNALKAYGCTVIYVTHNVYEAMALADNLIVMEDGRFLISGKPDEVYNSKSTAVELLKSGLMDFCIED
ncbi:MAG: ABC transporter ATP-binding protein [Clostridia bacterium]|nr:ABC transporter ATP-binding protein [Clostridia bacterium]